MAVNEQTFKGPMKAISSISIHMTEKSNRRSSYTLKPNLLPPLPLPLPTSPLQRQTCVSCDGQAISPIPLSRGSSCLSESELLDNKFRRDLEAYKMSVERTIHCIEADKAKVESYLNSPQHMHPLHESTKKRYETDLGAFQKSILHQKEKLTAIQSLMYLL